MHEFFLMIGVSFVILRSLLCIKSAKHRLVQAGYVLATIGTCLGLEYAGLRPILDHPIHQNMANYFGCIMLFLGLNGFLLFASMEQLLRNISKKTDALAN